VMISSCVAFAPARRGDLQRQVLMEDGRCVQAEDFFFGRADLAQVPAAGHSARGLSH
jgi:hypothetical protein